MAVTMAEAALGTSARSQVEALRARVGARRSCGDRRLYVCAEATLRFR